LARSLNILVFGAGMQGTLYGVRLARAGHSVTLVARGRRAAELRDRGAIIENALSGEREMIKLPVADKLAQCPPADLCFITVRREQLDSASSAIAMAPNIDRIVVMVNHACGSDKLFAGARHERTVLGFPGAAGSIENGVDRYVDVTQQPTVVDASCPDIAKVLQSAGFGVALIHDVDSWLRRHAVFVTAVSGALYEVGVDARRLAADSTRIRRMITAIREAWSAMDRLGVAQAPLALRAIFQWVPLPFAVIYWRRLLASPRGEYYFASHARRASTEMAALAADVRALLNHEPIPELSQLFAVIDATALRAQARSIAANVF
jgi:2-dehydropantoate 2-reductase